MKKLWKAINDYAMKIINHEKKKIIPLKSEELKSYLNHINCYICQKEFGDINDKKYCKVNDYW